MNHFERVDKVLKFKGFPRYWLAGQLGVPQNTFTRYFSVEQQSKLLPYLWEIYLIFPDISREWLFFDEGPMLQSEVLACKENNPELFEALKKNSLLSEENRNLRDRLNDLEKNMKAKQDNLVAHGLGNVVHSSRGGTE